MNETFQQPGRWNDIILTPAPRASSEPLSHIMSYTIKPLQPGSVYEAIVQAKNRYGWNEVNNLFSKYFDMFFIVVVIVLSSQSVCIPTYLYPIYSTHSIPLRTMIFTAPFSVYYMSQKYLYEGVAKLCR